LWERIERDQVAVTDELLLKAQFRAYIFLLWKSKYMSVFAMIPWTSTLLRTIGHAHVVGDLLLTLGVDKESR
jgi:hypothetical protein